ncbi:MAG: hypothetical protein ABIJ09_00060 [Pseudomonadota bacterium]
MTEEQSTTLHPTVAALARDFDLTDGQWSAPGERLVAHHQALQACGPELRNKLITDLVVLAGRFERETGAAGQTALAQLLALATLLLGGVQAAQEAFEEAGVHTAEARKLLGGDGLRFEDRAAQKPGQAAASLLGMLKKNK